MNRYIVRLGNGRNVYQGDDLRTAERMYEIYKCIAMRVSEHGHSSTVPAGARVDSYKFVILMDNGTG